MLTGEALNVYKPLVMLLIASCETAAQLELWLQTRDRLKANGEDFVQLDQQILPFKTKYVRSGAIYGANSAGMLRWFAEASPDKSAPAETTSAAA